MDIVYVGYIVGVLIGKCFIDSFFYLFLQDLKINCVESYFLGLFQELEYFNDKFEGVFFVRGERMGVFNFGLIIVLIFEVFKDFEFYV